VSTRLATIGGLTLVYALTLASFAPLDLAAGAVVATAVVALTGHAPEARSADGSSPPLAARFARFPILALAVLGEVVVGTWQVALVVTGLRPLRRPGIVAVPVGERTRAGVAATALAVTLSPGEVFVDLDEERGVMLIHVLDATDPAAVRLRHEAFYRRYQRGVFP
jgi:multicomponent Na+:H+ antiporter subunit E